jgi:hypothetical protein
MLDDMLDAPYLRGCGKHTFRSEWFTRGWTLQGLVPPKDLIFFCTTWTRLRGKAQLPSTIAQYRGIDEKVLFRKTSVDEVDIA